MKPYQLVPTRQFKKDFRRLEKSGFDMQRLEKVIDSLAAGEALDRKYDDHPLKGELAGIRECHIGPDWLLLYQKDDDKLILLLVGTGSHARMFGE